MKSKLKVLWEDRSLLLAAAGFALLILLLQGLGGAYQAEYDGHADEAAHFVSSLLVRDYLAQFPWPSPMPWAMEYYLHYPKVAIGHWPPGYYAVQGLWWLVVPPSRGSAMALNVLMGTGVMMLFWVLVGRLGVSRLLMAGAGVVMLLLPVMQQALSQAMAELPALLAAMVFLWTLTFVQERPGRLSIILVWLSLLIAFAVKQTSVGLCAAPVLALIFGGVWRRLPLGPMLLWPALSAAMVAGLLYWQYAGSIREAIRWAGASRTTKLGWSIDQVPEVAGWGILLLAAAGVWAAWSRREPVTLASLAVVVSFFVCSYFVRAFQETRHWIAFLPALLLLAAAGYRILSERSRWAPAALAAALLLMPHSWYRQSPGGYGALAAQIVQPSRMLVSSSAGWPEGPWIAVAALREKRPGSTILRATKLLASADWNARRYQSKVGVAEDVERILDGAGIELVILHNDSVGNLNLSHHALLRSTLAASPAWKQCGAAGLLQAYCRQGPARYPRTPLRIELNRMGVKELEEN